MTEFISMTARRTLATDVRALNAALIQLDDLLATMAAADYIAKPLNASGSIGGHVRHVLDHIQPWLRASEQVGKQVPARIDYESRERGTPVESDLQCGRDMLAEIHHRLDRLPDQWTRSAVEVIQMLNPALPAIVMPSSLSRELAFVISHTIHHQAMIAQIAETLDLSVPDGFGYAPATLVHLRRTGR